MELYVHSEKEYKYHIGTKIYVYFNNEEMEKHYRIMVSEGWKAINYNATTIHRLDDQGVKYETITYEKVELN